jgi:hypothetical protein
MLGQVRNVIRKVANGSRGSLHEVRFVKLEPADGETVRSADVAEAIAYRPKRESRQPILL